MSRAVSTVVDTLLCLLLVSAAVFVVTTPTSRPPDLDADDTAEVLATSTAGFEYTFERGDSTVRRRTRGTYAGLLGRAAVANATLSGQPLSPGSDRFVSRVRDRVAAVVGANTQVTARWTPYPGAPIAGRVTVGSDPPPRADVHVERMRTPVVVPSVDSTGTYEMVAAAVADAVTRGLLPNTPAALPQAGVARSAVRHRIDVLTGARNRSVRSRLAAGNASAARAVVTRALAARLATDLERRFETPGRAAAAASPGTATVTVRRWDR